MPNFCSLALLKCYISYLHVLYVSSHINGSAHIKNICIYKLYRFLILYIKKFTIFWGPWNPDQIYFQRGPDRFWNVGKVERRIFSSCYF